MPKSEYRPYLEAVEEVLVRFRTDTAGMEIIRDALFEVACNPNGLDEENSTSWTLPDDALELLVTLPSPGGVRRTAEDRLRKNVNEERSKRREREAELLRREADAAREQVNSSRRSTGTATAEELAVDATSAVAADDELVTVDPVVEEAEENGVT